jgi:hypothetical protein
MSALAPAPSCASTWSDNGLREGCAPGRTRFHWNSVSLSRTSWPSVSFFTVSRWSRRAKGSQVCGEARCAGMIVTLARARCSTLTGAGSAGGTAKARSRRNMNHACRASPFCELAHRFNLNPSPDGPVPAPDLRLQPRRKCHWDRPDVRGFEPSSLKSILGSIGLFQDFNILSSDASHHWRPRSPARAQRQPRPQPQQGIAGGPGQNAPLSIRNLRPLRSLRRASWQWRGSRKLRILPWRAWPEGDAPIRGG